MSEYGHAYYAATGMDVQREIAIMDYVTQLGALNSEWMQWVLQSDPFAITEGLEFDSVVVAEPSDWHCHYCGGLRRADTYGCSGCGAARS